MVRGEFPSCLLCSKPHFLMPLYSHAPKFAKVASISYLNFYSYILVAAYEEIFKIKIKVVSKIQSYQDDIS